MKNGMLARRFMTTFQLASYALGNNQMKSRKEMIDHIAERWLDDIDIKSGFRVKTRIKVVLAEAYFDELKSWSDSDIEEEYKNKKWYNAN